MSSRAFTKFQVGVFDTAEKIYSIFSALEQDELDGWTKKSKIEFPVSAGVRTMPDFEVHKFSNEGVKMPYVSKMKRKENGAVEVIKFAEELLTESNYQETVEQAIVQKIVFDLRAEFYKAPKRDEGGKQLKGSGSKNITPYGVACVDMFEMLGVEHTYKNEFKDFKYIRTLIKKPQTEKQKSSLTNGQTSKSRKGVKKGKTQKTIQLETLLETANKELTTLKSFILYLHAEGKINFTETDQKAFYQLVKEVKEDEDGITYKSGLGLADTQLSKSPSPPQSPEKREEILPYISEEFLTNTDDEEVGEDPTDLTDTDEEIEEDADQYKQVCMGELCDTVLGEMVPIMCYMNEKRGDKTLCRTCYVDGNYKEDDENEDNEDSDDEDEVEEKTVDVCEDLFSETEDEEEEDDESERTERGIGAMVECEEFLEEYGAFDFNPFMKKIKREDRESGGARAEKWSKENKGDTINELLEEFLEMLGDWKEDLDDFPDLELAIASWTDTLKERTE